MTPLHIIETSHIKYQSSPSKSGFWGNPGGSKQQTTLHISDFQPIGSHGTMPPNSHKAPQIGHKVKLLVPTDKIQPVGQGSSGSKQSAQKNQIIIL